MESFRNRDQKKKKKHLRTICTTIDIFSIKPNTSGVGAKLGPVPQTSQTECQSQMGGSVREVWAVWGVYTAYTRYPILLMRSCEVGKHIQVMIQVMRNKEWVAYIKMETASVPIDDIEETDTK